MAGVNEGKKKTGKGSIRARNGASFKKRKGCIKKKTMELSVLCDIQACAIFVGPDGKLETWPENCELVLQLLNRYRESQEFGRMKSGNEVVEVQGLPCSSLNACNDEFESSDEEEGVVMAGVNEGKKKTGKGSIRARNGASFKKRKGCIKKKTMELSVLCDIQACAIFVGPDGKLETWPENCEQVLQLLNRYQESQEFGRMNSGNEVVEVQGLPCSSLNACNYEFESSEEEEFEAVIEELPSSLNATNPQELDQEIGGLINRDDATNQRELDQEIEGWTDWECFDPAEFAEWMNVNGDCSASDHHSAVMNQSDDVSLLDKFMYSH